MLRQRAIEIVGLGRIEGLDRRRKAFGDELGTMKLDDLNSMSVDELWKLREKVGAILAEKTAAEITVLERYLQRLQPGSQYRSARIIRTMGRLWKQPCGATSRLDMITGKIDRRFSDLFTGGVSGSAIAFFFCGLSDVLPGRKASPF